MIFASDNWAGASDKVMAAVAVQAAGVSPAYGSDPLSETVRQRFSALFERQVEVFFVGTGTAANALAISAYSRPGGVVFAHSQAHILVDEANAIALFGGGLNGVGLEGAGGKFTPDELVTAIARYPQGFFHHGQPVAVSLSQITELGQAYGPDEIRAIAGAAKGRGLAVHMDGARFAAAVTALGAAPADLTWKAGVDVLSFGGTKGGCLAAEAVVFFDPAHARDFGYARQRAGHGFSKAWFIAAQFDAWLDGGHWLDLANHANRQAARLAGAIRSSGEARLAIDPAANEVFAVLSEGLDARLKAAGAVYHPWSEAGFPRSGRPAAGEVLVRLVTSFRTGDEETERFEAIVATS